jgi:hypothetical protein
MKDGTVNALICWHTDRLYRSMRDLERLIEVADAAGAPIRTVQVGDLDLSTSAGRMVARILGPICSSLARPPGRESARPRPPFGQYLVTANPTTDTASSAWGVPVLVTTQLPAGDGVLLDGRKFGYAVIREPLVVRIGCALDDLTRNIIRLIAEERMTLAITRPPG